MIEGVQRRATKLVACMQDFNYNVRLKMLGLQRLEERRMRSDLIETIRNYSWLNLVFLFCGFNSVFYLILSF